MNTGNTVIIVLRALLLLLSFCGLCAGVRRLLGLSRFVAPLVASCATVSWLMLFGMAGILDIGFWLLYAAGLILVAWVWLVKRDRPDWRLILALCAYIAYLIWRFGKCYLSHNDDLSHWGLVSRFLLEERAFPDVRAGIVKFQSYPLGSAAWIFYVCRTIGSAWEGLWFVAQYLWIGLAFLPVLSIIHSNRYPLGTLAFASFLFLLQRNVNFTSLQVDWLIAFLGIGAVATMYSCEDTPGIALIVSIPICMAMVFVKSSGCFFAALTAIVMFCTVKGKTRRQRLGYCAVCCACFLSAFALWMVHVHLAFPAGLSSKHAVSVSRWSGELHAKGWRNILFIAAKMAYYFVKPNIHSAAGWLYLALCAHLLFFGSRILANGHYDRRKAIKDLLDGVIVYIAWYIMLTLMYIFSMPLSEALRLASYPRYTSTGLSFMMGFSLLQIIKVFGARGARLEFRPSKPFIGLLALFVALVVAVMPYLSIWERLFHRDTALIPLRVKLNYAHSALDLPKNSRLLLCYDAREYPDITLNGVRNITKYHFYTFDIDSIVIINNKTPEADQPFQWVTYISDKTEPISDPIEIIEEKLEGYDACIVLDRMDDIDGALRECLSEYGEGVKVVYACDII